MSNDNLIVDLDDTCSVSRSSGGIPLIVCYKTGISYTAQTGGYACNHPHAEELVINIGGLEEFIDFDDCKIGCWGEREESKAHADAIDRCLTKYNEQHAQYGSNGMFRIDSLRFNYNKIKELSEGWWPVIVFYTLKVYKEGIKEEDKELYVLDGYIHMGNCD